jgi:hypothetical protein
MKKEIVILHEGVVASWLKDIFTFGSICLLLNINEKYFGGDGGVSVVLILMAITVCCVRLGTNNFYSKEDAKKYIEDLKI